MSKSIKRIAAFLLCIGLAASLATTAFATNPGEQVFSKEDTDGAWEAETGTSTTSPEVHGRAVPAMLSAEVTITTEFVIDAGATQENGREEFTPTTFTVTNTGKIPVKVSFESLKAKTLANHISLPVIASDAHTTEEWAALNATETKAGIALGVKGTANTSVDSWFPAEAGQSAATAIEITDNLPAAGTEQAGVPIDNAMFELQAKYGLAWDAAYSFAYDAVFVVEIAS